MRRCTSRTTSSASVSILLRRSPSGHSAVGHPPPTLRPSGGPHTAVRAVGSSTLLAVAHGCDSIASGGGIGSLEVQALRVTGGLALWAYGSVHQHRCHRILADLRKPKAEVLVRAKLSAAISPPTCCWPRAGRGRWTGRAVRDPTWRLVCAAGLPALHR